MAAAPAPAPARRNLRVDYVIGGRTFIGFSDHRVNPVNGNLILTHLFGYEAEVALADITQSKEDPELGQRLTLPPINPPPPANNIPQGLLPGTLVHYEYNRVHYYGTITANRIVYTTNIDPADTANFGTNQLDNFPNIPQSSIYEILHRGGIVQAVARNLVDVVQPGAGGIPNNPDITDAPPGASVEMAKTISIAAAILTATVSAIEPAKAFGSSAASYVTATAAYVGSKVGSFGPIAAIGPMVEGKLGFVADAASAASAAAGGMGAYARQASEIAYRQVVASPWIWGPLILAGAIYGSAKIINGCSGCRNTLKLQMKYLKYKQKYLNQKNKK